MKRGQFKRGSKPSWFWLGDEPSRPWPERLRALCASVAANKRARHNGGARRSQRDSDLRRAIRDGYLEVTRRGHDCNPRAKGLVLTPAGRALLQVPTPTHTPGPYAKRRQALAEFEEANRHD